MSGNRTGYAGTQASGDVLTSANFDKMPNGLVVWAQTATATTGIGTSRTVLTGLTMPAFTFQSDRFYRVEARVRLTNRSANNAVKTYFQTSGGGVVYACLAEVDMTTSTDAVTAFGAYIDDGLSGSITTAIAVACVGSGTVDTDPGAAHGDPGADYCAIFDCGPAF